MKVWDLKKEFRYAHLKRDGWNLQIRRLPNGVLLGLTRSGIIPVPEHIKEPLDRPLDERPCWTLSGELYHPDAPASQVSRCLNEDPGALQFEAYDCNLLKRSTSLEEAELWFAKQDVRFIPYLCNWNSEKHPEDENLRQRLGTFDNEQLVEFSGLCRIFEKCNHEGWVLKDSLGGPMFKHKEFRTADVCIRGITMGEGRLEGTVGALVCEDGNGNEVANVFGMSDEQRQDMLRLHLNKQLVGKIIECKYQLKEETGRLRHPTFVRFRPDLKEAQCTI